MLYGLFASEMRLNFQGAVAEHAIYCSTKAALDMLSRVMALELGPHAIRVNCVNPTVVMTAMGKLGWSDPKKASNMIGKIPLGKFAGSYSFYGATSKLNF